ncbi:MAG: phosphoribosylamine--glycine ligase [Chthoniobacteraceae bacterium]
MKVLVIGSGGREHALAWKLKQSPRVAQVFCAPGNGGIAQVATCVPIKISDHAALIDFAKREGIALTVVGPDDALAAGIVDHFQAAGLRIFGPSQRAAQLESSKVFAKDFMLRHGIPCARSAGFDDPIAAQAYAQKIGAPMVVKADGLALGKGVLICHNQREAAFAIWEIMERRAFGDAGRRVVIEEFLEGEECSIHALVDGRGYLLFPGAQDHKRALDGDEGLNTGGMGTFSPPAHLLTPELEARVRTEVLDRFIAGLAKDALDFRGMLFPGLIITRDGLKVLEFNCRFGDPETQVLLTRLESDLVDLLEATIDQRLDSISASWKPDAAVCVVMASGGYPAKYATGKTITGLDAADAVVFHAGTRQEDGRVVTAGGRVLGVTALGPTLATARDRAYAAVRRIHFEGAHHRSDIAAKGLRA